MPPLSFRYYTLILTGILTASLTSFSQGINLGIPPMQQYPKKVYGAGTQNWDAAQDSRQIMYWANNEGLLTYNGTSWACLPVSNNTIVRSVAIDAQDRIYTGAQSEMGYFSPGSAGRLTYTSLVPLLPEHERVFEDIWDIVVLGTSVYFRTNDKVYAYNQSGFRIHVPGGEILHMFKYGNQLVIQTQPDSLFTLDDSGFTFLTTIPGLQSALTGQMAWGGDTLLMSSLKDGLFYLIGNKAGTWHTHADAKLKANRIYSSTPLANGSIALGTSLDGLMIMDRDGRISWHINKKSGLQNNNILHTFCDRRGNIWLGLDNGIDFINFTSPIRFVYPDGEMQATGYSAIRYDEDLYLGVSNGAYVAPWKTYYDPEAGPLFKPVHGTEGQVWNFNQVGGKLWMGHHEGAYILEANEVLPLHPESGAWTFIEISPGYVLGGFYDGLAVFTNASGAWKFLYKIEGIKESCRIIVKDDSGHIWISHPYRGLFKIDWTPSMGSKADIHFYDREDGLPSHLNNYVFGIGGKAFFGTEQGVYTYDPESDQCVPADDFNQWIGSRQRVKYLREDLMGNIWFLTAEEAGVLLIDDDGLKKKVTKKVMPELLDKYVGGFESMYPVDSENILIASEQGFIHYRFRPDAVEDTLFSLILDRVSTQGKNDSVLFSGLASFPYPAVLEGPVLPAHLNNVEFSYSATAFGVQPYIEYRTQLEGLEETWSPWSQDVRKNYTNLGSGSYRFHVEARIKNTTHTKTIHYAFRIRPPWYKSGLALGFYTLGCFGLIAGFMVHQRQRFEKEKAKMTQTHQLKEAAHQLAVEQSKAALSEVKHEKLQAEINYKNQELALTTMHLVQKAEILLAVQNALHQIRDKSASPEARKDIQQLLNMINFDVKLDEDWEHFAFHFDQVHVHFLKHLRERYPQLSANDLKLCAYLRMNLSTKEIAPLLNISVRGVEGSRYRLRKKLHLSNDANLTDFMLNLNPQVSPNEKAEKTEITPRGPKEND